MDEPKNQEETPELEVGAEGEPEEGDVHEGHHEGSKAPDAPRGKESGWLSKLIWLVILVLIVWGGWVAYKRGTAQDAAGEPEAAAETGTPAAGTPAQ
ncbi:MAG: hypothetical protein AAB633_01685 [Patescibacteria group bacterium]